MAIGWGQEVQGGQSPSAALWLHSRGFDLAWYLGVPLVVLVAFPWAAWALGPKGPALAYAFNSVLTGLPHNVLTWFLLLPATARPRYGLGVYLLPLALTALVMGAVVATLGQATLSYPVSLVVAIAYFHIVRQHQGMVHAADARLLQATRELQAQGWAHGAQLEAIRPMGHHLRWALGAWALGLAYLKLTGTQPVLAFGQVPIPFAFWPAPAAGLVPIGLVWAWHLGACTWQAARWLRSGGPTPWLHLAFGGAAALVIGGGYLVPNEDFLLTFAMIAAGHNFQYMAFVWTHHRLRAEAEPLDQDWMSRCARERRWAAYFATMLGCSFAYTAVAASLPPDGMTVMLMTFMLSHYLIDGAMWRRKHYPLMTTYAARRPAP